ncbi:MAG: hypothetical protein Tsb0020_17650 [Haliangiales bacterium]
MSQRLEPKPGARRRANEHDVIVQRAPSQQRARKNANAQPIQRKAPPARGHAGEVPARSWSQDPNMQAAHGHVQRRAADTDLAVRPSADAAAVQRSEVEGEREDKKGGFLASVGGAMRGLSERLKRLAGNLATDRFDDLDASMYRVTMDGGERKVEAIARMQDTDGTVFYVATGLVTGFSGERPIVQSYQPVVDLGDWTPRVTHVNGMMVTPESGINGATQLHEEIASQLDDAALAPDVLYTYSAKGGFFPDLIDSAKGKLGIDDAVIESQEQLILDAVRDGRRITMSAHSRGTIKTDVAVRNAHSVLREELAAELVSSPEADAAAAEAEDMARQLAAAGQPTIAPGLAAQIARRGAAERLSGQRAWDTIEAHVQLIYAGNAVKFPSPPAELVVGRSDFVSISVGTYFQLGRDIKRFEKISGGHSFDENYAETVGAWIAADLNGTPL